MGLLCVVPVRGPALGLSLAGPSGFGLGLCVARSFACVDLVTRFRPLDAGDGEMRQGATGGRQCGDRKTTGWRQEDDRKAAGKRQESDRKRQAGDKKVTGELRQEGNMRATGGRQGADRVATGKQQESERNTIGVQQGHRRQGSDREAIGESDRRATGERQDSDRRAAGCFSATGRQQKGDRLVKEDKGNKIVHGFLYRWIYVKKMGSNVLHLFGFLLRCHFIDSGIYF